MDPFHTWAIEQIALAVDVSTAVVGPVALAEFLVGCDGNDASLSKLQAWGLIFVPLQPKVSVLAAQAFKSYLARLPEADRARRRRIPLPDFFIAAHAFLDDAPLVLTDLRHFQTYFPELRLIRPLSGN